MKNTKVIAAFPACGKSTIVNKYKDNNIKILDSDSSEFHWVAEPIRFTPPLDDFNDNPCPIKVKRANPDWPMNYINHIKENIGKVDAIFVSSHKEVRELLFNNDIDFTLVVPCNRDTCLYEWIGRMYMRKSSEDFIKNIIMNWDKWLIEIENENTYTDIIYLSEYQFLEDVMPIETEHETYLYQ